MTKMPRVAYNPWHPAKNIQWFPLSDPLFCSAGLAQPHKSFLKTPVDERLRFESGIAITSGAVRKDHLRISALAVVILLSCAIPMSAYGNTVTYSSAFSLKPASGGSTITATQNVNLKMFDLAGTLTKVSWTMQYDTFKTKFSVTSQQAVAAGTSAEVLLIPYTVYNVSPAVTLQPNFVHYKVDGPFQPGTTNYEATFAGLTYTSFNDNTPSVFSRFTAPTGSGQTLVTTAAMSLVGSTTNLNTGNGGVTISPVDPFTGVVSIAYDYTPTAVPLPVAAWGGLALVGQLGLRRKRASV